MKDGTWAQLWTGNGRRERGGGAAGALLPALAVHGWLNQKGSVPGWTGAVVLPYRRLARLAGLDKDTVTTAVGDLVNAGLVLVEREQIGGDDPRVAARFRVAAQAYAGDDERHVRFASAFVYGGGWSCLPGAAARHLAIAWAAWAWDAIVDPKIGSLPRTERLVAEALKAPSGMGRTALWRAFSDLGRWGTPDGALLVQHREGLMRPKLDGAAALYEWPLTETPSPEAAPETVAGVSAELTPDLQAETPTKEPVAAEPSASDMSPDGPRPIHLADRPAAPAPPLAPAPSRVRQPYRPGGFERLKEWWIERYLKAWLNRMVRRREGRPDRVLFVDLCPGDGHGGIPPALRRVVRIALEGHRRWRQMTPRFQVVAVERDRDRWRELCSRVEFFPVLKVLDLPVEEVLAKEAGGGNTAVLTFAGDVEACQLSSTALRRALTGPARELVAVCRPGSLDDPRARLWRLRQQNASNPETSLERFALATLEAGGHHAFLEEIVTEGGEPMGGLLHVASRYGALGAFKLATSARRRASVVSDDGLRPGEGPCAAELADHLAQRFRRQEVAWTRTDRGPALRRYLLEDTAGLPRDFVQVRRELRARGWRLAGRKNVFRFPDV